MWNPFGRRGRAPARLQSVTVNIPYAGSATFVPDETEIKAAWSLFVEISTRVPIQSIDPEYGSIREALTSIYSLFGETRRILAQAGPSVAHGKDSLAPLAIAVLNNGLRPFLTKWHSELQAYERKRTSDKSVVEYERDWAKFDECMTTLRELQENLDRYRTELLKLTGAKLEEA